MLGQQLVEMLAHGMVCLQRQALANAGHGGMLRGGVCGFQSHELAHGQGVLAAPTDAALGINALEVTQEQHPEIASRWDGRTSQLFGVKRGAEFFDKGVEARFAQKGVQLLV